MGFDMQIEPFAFEMDEAELPTDLEERGAEQKADAAAIATTRRPSPGRNRRSHRAGPGQHACAAAFSPSALNPRHPRRQRTCALGAKRLERCTEPAPARGWRDDPRDAQRHPQLPKAAGLAGRWHCWARHRARVDRSPAARAMLPINMPSPADAQPDANLTDEMAWLRTGLGDSV